MKDLRIQSPPGGIGGLVAIAGLRFRFQTSQHLNFWGSHGSPIAGTRQVGSGTLGQKTVRSTPSGGSAIIFILWYYVVDYVD